MSERAESIPFFQLCCIAPVHHPPFISCGSLCSSPTITPWSEVGIMHRFCPAWWKLILSKLYCVYTWPCNVEISVCWWNTSESFCVISSVDDRECEKPVFKRCFASETSAATSFNKCLLQGFSLHDFDREEKINYVQQVCWSWPVTSATPVLFCMQYTWMTLVWPLLCF